MPATSPKHARFHMVHTTSKARLSKRQHTSFTWQIDWPVSPSCLPRGSKTLRDRELRELPLSFCSDPCRLPANKTCVLGSCSDRSTTTITWLGVPTDTETALVSYSKLSRDKKLRHCHTLRNISTHWILQCCVSQTVSHFKMSLTKATKLSRPLLHVGLLSTASTAAAGQPSLAMPVLQLGHPTLRKVGYLRTSTRSFMLVLCLLATKRLFRTEKLASIHAVQ